MWKPFALLCVMPLAACAVVGADDNPKPRSDAKRLSGALPSTWENVSRTSAPKEIGFIKHVTPTHYTWVVFDREKHAIAAITGGRWTLEDGKYGESIEFASDNAQQLRGKTFQFTINLDGDKWEHKGVPDSEIKVDEVWMRKKPSDQQKKNTDEPGRQLLGTWEQGLGPRAPKAVRMRKHVTPTHWTWVIYDRENKRVSTAMGGTWSLRNGEYVEDVQFATGNIEKAGGTSHSYKFRIDGDRWILKAGPNVRLNEDETWTRIKAPNP